MSFVHPVAFRDEHGHGQLIGPDVPVVETGHFFAGHFLEIEKVVCFGLFAVFKEFQVAELAGKAGQGLLGQEQRAFQIQFGAAQFLVGEVERREGGQFGVELGPEFVDLFLVKRGRDVEDAAPFKGDGGCGDIIHQLLVVLEGAVEPRGVVAAHDLGQDFQAHVFHRAATRNGEGRGQVDLVPLAFHFDHFRALADRRDFHHPGRGQGHGVFQGAKNALGFGQHLVRIYFADHGEQHGLGLVMVSDILLHGLAARFLSTVSR